MSSERQSFRVAIDPSASAALRRRLRKARKLQQEEPPSPTDLRVDWASDQLAYAMVAIILLGGATVPLLLLTHIALHVYWGVWNPSGETRRSIEQFPLWDFGNTVLAIVLVIGAFVASLLGKFYLEYRARKSWDRYTIDPDRQFNATREHRSPRVRLVRINRVLDRLDKQRHSDVLGTVVTIDDDLLDEVHFHLVTTIMNWADLAKAVADAGTYPELADQLQASQRELHAFEELVDTGIAPLQHVADAADVVRARHDEATTSAQRTERFHQLTSQLGIDATKTSRADDPLTQAVTTLKQAVESLRAARQVPPRP